MKMISLTQDKFAIVDDANYNSLNKYKWYTFKSLTTCYAVRNAPISESGQRQIRMHNIILSPPKGVEVDHKNGNGLDNRISNLRFCNRSENKRSQRLSRDNTSGFKGVTLRSRVQKTVYVARIGVNKREIHLGYYPTLEAAARAYDRAALKYHGDFAMTNEKLGLFETQKERLSTADFKCSGAK